MTANADIPTDLLTPLGAYLRLREGAARELPARVGRAGTARPPLFIGSGSRLVGLRGGGGSWTRPVVGYLAYDHIAKLEPTVPLPDGRPRPAGEPLHRRRDARPLRPRQRHGRGAGGRSGRDRGPARERLVFQEHKVPARARERFARFPSRRRTRTASRGSRSCIRAGDAFQVVLSQRAERRTSASALAALPGAAARQPLAVPLPARARRARADRLVAGDARQVRGRPREPEPDRRHDRARRGRRRAAARLREGPGRARDARRPRPQRLLPRLHARDASASRASSSPSASRTSRTSSRR